MTFQQSSPAPPSAPRRRSGAVMILTSVCWHALVIGLLLAAAWSGPDDPNCEWTCQPQDRVFIAAIFLAIPLAISLVVTEVLIVAQVKDARRAAERAGQEPAPASLWRDVRLATGMTLAGMVSSVVAVGTYMAVSHAL